MQHFDIVVAGAGVGGISVAIASARNGASVLLIERDTSVGGTSVHSPVALICTIRDSAGRFINAGLHQEFFPLPYRPHTTGIETYDEADLAQRYDTLLAAEKNITIWTSTEVTATTQARHLRVPGRDDAPGRIASIATAGQHAGTVSANVFIDSTANGNLATLAGVQFQVGREGDHAMQPSTLTFKVVDVDYTKFQCLGGKASPDPWDWTIWKQMVAELNPYYHAVHAAGKTSNTREDVLFFLYPDGQALLFNQTRILGVDPSDPASVEAGVAEGRKQIAEFFPAIQRHPAFAGARIASISPTLGIREGRRVLGDYVLTEADCLAEARFPDMVGACGYPIDIHNPTGTGTRMASIPNSGYYHIPYRCLIAKGFTNLLLGSRCISGTHEAHSSYRVMGPISAIGQAAGTAAALAVRHRKQDVREVAAEHIRYVLQEAGQFVEGTVESAF